MTCGSIVCQTQPSFMPVAKGFLGPFITSKQNAFSFKRWYNLLSFFTCDIRISYTDAQQSGLARDANWHIKILVTVSCSVMFGFNNIYYISTSLALQCL